MSEHDLSGSAHGPAPDPLPPVGGRRKRAFDICFALAGLLILAPLLVGVAGMLAIVSGGVFLRRESCVGAGGRVFNCLWFGGVGASAFARKLALALDRSGIAGLPRLVNVLRGDMSVVGPAPIRASEPLVCNASLDAYRRARPGMISFAATPTGLRFVPPEPQDYVRNWSFRGDLRLLWTAVTQCSVRVFY